MNGRPVTPHLAGCQLLIMVGSRFSPAGLCTSFLEKGKLFSDIKDYIFIDLCRVIQIVFCVVNVALHMVDLESETHKVTAISEPYGQSYL